MNPMLSTSAYPARLPSASHEQETALQAPGVSPPSPAQKPAAIALDPAALLDIDSLVKNWHLPSTAQPPTGQQAPSKIFARQDIEAMNLDLFTDQDDLVINGDRLALTVPRAWLAPSSEAGRISLAELGKIMDTMDKMFEFGAELTGFSRPGQFIYAQIQQEEKVTGNFFFGKWLSMTAPSPEYLRTLIDPTLNLETPDSLQKISAFPSLVVGHEIGHFFEHQFSTLLKDFPENMVDVISAYINEKGGYPFHTTHDLSNEQKQAHFNQGSYQDVKKPYSSYSLALFMEIKDAGGGWDIYKKAFRDLTEKPVPADASNEGRWGWFADIIESGSDVNIRPILEKYHVPFADYVKPEQSQLEQDQAPLPVHAVHLVGTAQDDILGAKDADNQSYTTLRGEEGSDILYGSKGRTELEGGRGKDHFIFMEKDRGHNTIYDFNAWSSKDRITIYLNSGDFPNIAQKGKDVVITFQYGGDIRIKDCNLADLTNENIEFLTLNSQNKPDTDGGFSLQNNTINNTIISGVNGTKDAFSLVAGGNTELNHFSQKDGDTIRVPTPDFYQTMTNTFEDDGNTLFAFEDGTVLTVHGIKPSEFTPRDFEYAIPEKVEVQFPLGRA